MGITERLRATSDMEEAGYVPIPISVNLSVQQLLQNDFVWVVRDMLVDFEMDAKWLEIEITESTLLRNEDALAIELNFFRDLGVLISIDDFGTGYSSLSRLQRFSFTSLKIDRSFIHNICDKPQNRSIVHAIVQLAKALEMKVVAEGVETAQQLNLLREMKCDEIQGFIYSHPLPAIKFASLLRQRTCVVQESLPRKTST